MRNECLRLIKPRYTFDFTKEQIEFIIKEHGEANAEEILTLCKNHNINPLYLKKTIGGKD
jgi:hypothetical protein